MILMNNPSIDNLVNIPSAYFNKMVSFCRLKAPVSAIDAYERQPSKISSLPTVIL